MSHFRDSYRINLESWNIVDYYILDYKLEGMMRDFELLNYWDSQKFKDKSTQNKVNRGSARGGALHSTG